MDFTPLSTISPIDGRYHSKTSALQPYFSEFGLIRYRVLIEIEYFIALMKTGVVPNTELISEEELRSWYIHFTPSDAERIKTIERTTNHDVKAVEYFLKEKFDAKNWSFCAEFIHFGLTSQDINNTAIPLSLKEGIVNELFPLYDEVLAKLKSLASAWKDIPLLARTHGQPASPTRLGKEIQVFAERLEIQLNVAKRIPYASKFGGATGNFNAHHVAYPAINWVDFANNFLGSLGLARSQTTTQIEHYDSMAALFDAFKRMNTIILDLNRDLWTYISMDYFKQKLKEGEIGSSAMPHKVNPIDFENSEGNLGIANALFEHFAAKLPISRLQRDLTDSTVLRNIGTPLAHTVIALKATMVGLNKVVLNEDKIHSDLENNWMVVAEAIQTILRRENYPKPYEALKELTRTHDKVTKETIHHFIDNLAVTNGVKEELKAISPWNYLGIQLVD